MIMNYKLKINNVLYNNNILKVCFITRKKIMSFNVIDHITKINNIFNKEIINGNINNYDYLSIMELIISNIKNNLQEDKKNKFIITTINDNNINITLINKKLSTFNKNILISDEFDFIDKIKKKDNIAYSSMGIVLKNLKKKKLDTKKLWADFSDDDYNYVLDECSASDNTAASMVYPSKKPDNNYNDVKTNTSFLNEKMLKKYKDNCETTIKYIIDKYNNNHYDSYRNIKEVNLILYRLMGIDHKKLIKKAYSRCCWFLRNNPCNYESNCNANNFNMCTYAHKSNESNIQYCCSVEEGYYNWPDNYYKCLKKTNIDSDYDLCEYIENLGNKKINLDEIELIPDFVKNWYTDIIFNSDFEHQV